MTDTHVLYIVSGVGTAGAIAIAAMWKWMLAQVKDLKKRADESDEKHSECQQDRDMLAMKVGELTSDKTLLARCPGSHDGTCPNWTEAKLQRFFNRQAAMASCPIRLQNMLTSGNLPPDGQNGQSNES